MHKTHIQRAHGPRAPSWDQETGAKMALIGKNLESARIIKKCSNEMICATKWNFRSCFEKVYRSYWSPFISVAKEGAGKYIYIHRCTYVLGTNWINRIYLRYIPSSVI